MTEREEGEQDRLHADCVLWEGVLLHLVHEQPDRDDHVDCEIGGLVEVHTCEGNRHETVDTNILTELTGFLLLLLVVVSALSLHPI